MEEMNHNVEIPTEEVKAKTKTTLLKEIYDYFELFIISACAVLLLFSFATRICRVDGPSMLNTLHDSEMLLVTDLFYTPERGDIVVFHQTGDQPSDLNEPIVKRVIATEGETVKITKNGEVFVDGVPLNESEYVYIDELDYTYEELEITVLEGEIFVMGDHRNKSYDSREIGTVSEDSVLGKVLLRFYPFNKFGTVK
jgi:signal peptidase I